MPDSKMSLHEKFDKEFNTSLLEKWDPYIKGIKQAMPEFTTVGAINLAIVCENCEAEARKYNKNIWEMTQSADVGPYVRHAFKLLAGLMPNLCAEEVVSVQALKQKIGQIFFLKYVYGSTKGKTRKGDVAWDAREMNVDEDYSSERVPQEIVGDLGETSYSGNLAYGPVIAGSVVVTAGTVKGVDDGEGHITGTGITSGTIDYASGAYSLVFASATADDVEFAYEFNLENAPVAAPEFDLKVDEITVKAHSRKLRARYSFDAAYDMEKQFGENADDLLLEGTISEIKHEIDHEIFNDLYRQAGLSNSWNIIPRTAITEEAHYKTFLTKLNEMGNQILKATKRAKGNFVITGTNGATVIESLPSFVPTDTSDVVGCHVAGSIKGHYKVIVDPFYNDDDFLVGYKGRDFFDAGYVYAPYIPVFATNVIMLDDFVSRRGFGTSYAKKMINANYFVKGKITHNADVTPISVSGAVDATVKNTEANPVPTLAVTK